MVGALVISSTKESIFVKSFFETKTEGILRLHSEFWTYGRKVRSEARWPGGSPGGWMDGRMNIRKEGVTKGRPW